MNLVAYLVLWTFVAFVSAFDTYVNIRHPVTTVTELNPLARVVLQASENDVALLIALKLLGTSVVLSVLLLGYFYKREYAWPIISGIVLFQLGLLVFLIYG